MPCSTKNSPESEGRCRFLRSGSACFSLEEFRRVRGRSRSSSSILFSYVFLMITYDSCKHKGDGAENRLFLLCTCSFSPERKRKKVRLDRPSSGPLTPWTGRISPTRSSARITSSPPPSTSGWARRWLPPWPRQPGGPEWPGSDDIQKHPRGRISSVGVFFAGSGMTE